MYSDNNNDDDDDDDNNNNNNNNTEFRSCLVLSGNRFLKWLFYLLVSLLKSRGRRQIMRPCKRVRPVFPFFSP